MCHKNQQAGLENEEINLKREKKKYPETQKGNLALVLHRRRALLWSRDAGKLIKLLTGDLAES